MPSLSGGQINNMMHLHAERVARDHVRKLGDPHVFYRARSTGDWLVVSERFYRSPQGRHCRQSATMAVVINRDLSRTTIMIMA
jgi:hypothetical protein